MEKRLLGAGIISSEEAESTRAAARKWAIDARRVAMEAEMPDPANISEGVFAD
jgi:TPP-dependent pyruvate/acetoin dehydrogenase alpha subunit